MLYSSNVIASKNENNISNRNYTVRRATMNDAQGVVDLINKSACNDSDKIVIVPELFRLSYVQSAINEKRLFAASYDDKIVAFKKLFCITNENERDEIVKGELRLKGSKPVCSAKISNNEIEYIEPEEIEAALLAQGTYVYIGADFTDPDHRGVGINSKLTQHALESELSVAVEDIQKQKSAYLHIVYGLTQFNADNSNDVLAGRTKGIFREVVPFLQAVAQESNHLTPSRFLLSKHSAFKPSFDPKDTVCRPLPDEKSIPGYGNLIGCSLEKRK